MGIFQNIPGNRVKRSAFDLSHERKFSCNMGELIPILCEEVVPGDTFRNNTESLVRLAPMVAPMMHRVNVYTHFFFVPNRLLWTSWQDFITGGEDGQQLPAAPFIDLASGGALVKRGTLPDYLGVGSIDALPATQFRVNAMPFRAYQMIYNEYFRDQNLQSKISFGLGSGSVGGDFANLLPLRKRAWEKDYFTSSLPWTQRGGDVMMPGTVEWNQDATSYPILKTGAGTIAGTQQDLHAEATTGFLENTAGVNNIIDPNGTLQTGTLIEDLRRSTKLQQWLERNARGGSRYIEQILSHFGVKSSDARLQRPEYLGGGKSPITISEVLQTSESATTPQGGMAGHGVGVGNTHRFKKFFEEHGYVIGIMSILPRTAYVQGTRRHFYKNDKFDYYWPEFSQLGEQPVYDGELYETFGDSTNRGTFGYQSRYSEYKFIPSTVHGDFKGSLDFWHMSRKFTSAPALNSAFVTSDPTHRVFAVTDTAVDKLYVQVYNNLKAIRPMPYFNVPSL